MEAALSGDVTDAQREALLQCLVACVLRGVLSSEDMVDLWLDVLVEHDTSSADAETVGTMLAVSGFCGCVFAPQPDASMFGTQTLITQDVMAEEVLLHLHKRIRKAAVHSMEHGALPVTERSRQLRATLEEYFWGGTEQA